MISSVNVICIIIIVIVIIVIVVIVIVIIIIIIMMSATRVTGLILNRIFLQHSSLKFTPSKNYVIQGNALGTCSRVNYYACFGGLSLFPNDWKVWEVPAWAVFCLIRFKLANIALLDIHCLYITSRSFWFPTSY